MIHRLKPHGQETTEGHTWVHLELMAPGSWLMGHGLRLRAHGLRLVAQGSWFMAKTGILHEGRRPKTNYVIIHYVSKAIIAIWFAL